MIILRRRRRNKLRKIKKKRRNRWKERKRMKSLMKKKKIIKTVKRVDSDGFTTQKKIVIKKDDKGNKVESEIVKKDEVEVEEKKTSNKAILMNNMFELTKLERAYEPMNIEQTKQKLKKEKITLNNREHSLSKNKPPISKKKT